MKKVLLQTRSGDTVCRASIPDLVPRVDVIARLGKLYVYGGTHDDWIDIYVETTPYTLTIEDA